MTANKKICVVGNGMYVNGRGVGNGTVINSINQYFKKSKSYEIDILSRSGQPHQRYSSINHIVVGDLSSDLSQFVAYLETCNPSCVIVALPDTLHHPIIAEASKRDIPTLTVKPFVETTEQAFDLCAIEKKFGQNIFVEFHKRFDVQNRWLKHQISENTTGRISHIDVNYSQRLLIPTAVFTGWVETTNIFQYLGVHYVDLIYWLTSARPKRVFSYGVKNVLLNKYNIDTFDKVTSIIEWESDDHSFSSNLNIGWINNNNSPALSDQRMWLKSENLSLELDQMDRGIKIASERGYHYENPYFSDYIHSGTDGEPEYQGYGYESIAAFLDYAFDRSYHPNLCSASQATVSVAVTEAVNVSLKSGNWETVKL